jgi:23S rRNA (uridine2552-2'-O)-methyltransferase
MYLVELALDLALQTLRKDGGFLVKVFQGAGFDEFNKQVKKHFKVIKIRKPKASRARSREVYIYGLGFMG